MPGLRPKRMCRAHISVPLSRRARLVRSLHGISKFHVVQARPSAGTGFDLCPPLEDAGRYAEGLVDVRSVITALELERPLRTDAPVPADTAAARMERELPGLKAQVAALGKERSALQAREAGAEERRIRVTELSALPHALEDYRGYRSLDVMVGYTRGDAGPALSAISRDLSVSSVRTPKGFLTAVFVHNKDRELVEKVTRALAGAGFSAVEVPEGKGAPGDVAAKLALEEKDLEARLARVEGKLKGIREKNADRLWAWEEVLENSLEVEQTPLRAAASRHSFIVDGWIPLAQKKRFEERVKADLKGDVHVEFLGDRDLDVFDARSGGEAGGTSAMSASGSGRGKGGAGGSGEGGVGGGGGAGGEVGKEGGGGDDGGSEGDGEEEKLSVPILQDNPRPVKPAEYLVRMFSLPSYNEIDPAFMVMLTYPIFFGIMVGDVIKGLAIILIAFAARRIWPGEAMNKIFYLLLAAGTTALLFGMFVFGDALGIPFHAHGDETSWSDMLGFEIPLHALYHKLESSHVIELLVLSLSLGFLHIMAGFIIGIVNEAGHNNRHAIAKVGWVLILIALIGIAMSMASSTFLGGFIGEHFFRGGLESSMDVSGIAIPYLSLYLLVPGVILLVVGEGPLGAVEILGLIGNLISYSRLAAIAVADAATAFALNTIMLPWLLSGNVGLIIAGAVMMFVAHGFFTVLGTLTISIQAVRLNMVEFFLKFYKGDGEEYKPFGPRRTFSSDPVTSAPRRQESKTLEK